MRNYFLIGMIGISFFLYSCENVNLENTLITHIEVYETPFSITGPLHYTEKEARTWEPYKINEKKDLNEIRELLMLLIESGRKKINYTNIYLTCDIYLSNGKKMVLYYDKFKIKLNGIIYENSPALITKLVSPPVED